MLNTIGRGNTAVLAPGNYPGFTVPNGVAIYSPALGAAQINGNINCNGQTRCTIIGLTVNNGYIDLSNTSGARISRNTFNGGYDRGDGFGAGAIYAPHTSNARIDHNLFKGQKGVAIVAWNLDSSTITSNTFSDSTQGIDCDFSATGHGNDTFSYNYFSGISRMSIECGAGGDNSFYPAFSNISIIGNYSENFKWTSGSNQGGNVAYSIVGGQGGSNSTIINNTALGNGAVAIGIELNQTGKVRGNRILNMGYSCVEVYAKSGFDVENNNLSGCSLAVGNYQNGSGIIKNNANTSIIPAKPVTGPGAQ